MPKFIDKLVESAGELVKKIENGESIIADPVKRSETDGKVVGFDFIAERDAERGFDEYEFMSEWCDDYCEYVVEQAIRARGSAVGDIRDYVENQGKKYDLAEEIIGKFNKLKHCERPTYGTMRPMPSDDDGFISTFFMIDFTAMLVDMDAEKSAEAFSLFRDLINLCDDFNVFMLDPNDTEHDHMRCVFTFFNVENWEYIGEGDDDDAPRPFRVI